MKKNSRSALRVTICAGLFFPLLVQADAVLDFLVKENRDAAAISQSLLVKDGQVMIKAAWGNRDIDLLYSRSLESVVVVDHRKRTLMKVNEQEVSRINRQAQNVQPLLQGLSEQVAQLSPEQRQQWQELLGDSVSLKKIARASEAPQPGKWLSGRVTKKVAGISCQVKRLMEGETPMAEICLAAAAAMKLSKNDEAALRSLLGLYERIAASNQGMARQFGFSLPVITMAEMDGILVEARGLSHDDNGVATLSRVKIAIVAPELMTIPAGYKTVPLTFLK